MVDILDPEMNLADEEGEVDEELLSESDAMSSRHGKSMASEPGDKEWVAN